MKNEKIIEMHDLMVKSVSEGLMSLLKQLLDVAKQRPSALMCQAILGFLAARVYTSDALAYEYNRRQLWRNSPDRKAKDIDNYAAITWFTQRYDLTNYLPTIVDLVSDEMTISDDPALRKIELFLSESMVLRKSAKGRHLVFMMNELVESFAQIVYDENGKREMTIDATPPQYDEFYFGIVTDPHDLIMQQAHNIADFPRQIIETLQPLGSWPLVATQLLMITCNMDQALRFARQGKGKLTDNDRREASLLLTENIDELRTDLLALKLAARSVSDFTTTDFIDKLNATPYPLYTPSMSAFEYSWPFVQVLPDVIDRYLLMIDEYRRIPELINPR